MTAEMAEQPDVLRALIADAAEIRARVLALIDQPLHGVAFVARGSSDNAAVFGRYACELTTGLPAGLTAPSIHTRYRPRVDYRGQLVIGLSQSGATPEIVTTCERLRAAGARVIAITNDPASPLATAAELPLPLGAGDERAVPATKTVTAQMLMLALVAAALGDAPFSKDDLAGLPGAVARALADDEPVAALAAEWVEANRLVVVARGVMLAAALETALKITETAGISAHGISSADLLHGPIAALDAELPVLVLRGGGPADEDLDALVRRLAGTAVGAVQWPPAGDVPELLAPIVAVVRGHQLARAWALARGLDPDAPAGLSKVTATR
ncbi:MAG TPA: SIS domain-containing protein [Solirubrobacteraceae bacterium]|nr:SIS domain-containing protein [Solirubrobacteraceae bacterium]